MWALNYYITHSRRKSSGSRVADSWRRDVVGKATSGRRGLTALMSWGPEKMLIRCSKESQHPAEWIPASEQERHNVDGHKSGGQNITVYVRSPDPSHTQTLSNPFRTLAIKWEVNILLKKSSCVCHYHCVCVYHCVGMYPAYICIFLHEHVYENITYIYIYIYIYRLRQSRKDR